jgi:pyridoxal phosphate enzyme (YggS family)
MRRREGKSAFSSLTQGIMATIADNLQAIRTRLGAVTLLAVSKGQEIGKIREAAAAGQRAFGENYVQEAVEKMDRMEPREQGVEGLEWHLIGPLQSNKTRFVAERFDWVQTVASEKIARRLSEQRPAGKAPLNVLVQVNVSGESSKSGVFAQDAPGLCRQIGSLKSLNLRGLMAIPEPGAPRARFHEVKVLFDSLKGEFGFDTLSMGMSDDLELAIAEGSTMVRVGTAIFGSRDKVKSAA